MLNAIQRHSLWGQVFEIAAKRGVLTSLLVSHVKKPDDLGLEPWHNADIGAVYNAIAREIREVDPNEKRQTLAAVQHLFQLGMGLGQTVMREYLKALKPDAENYYIRALWCPLQMPRVQGDFDTEEEDSLHSFWYRFGQIGPPDPKLTNKGYPVRADFLLWLDTEFEALPNQLLCIEFSLNGLPEKINFSESEAHLDELRRYAWFVDSRSVFSRVCAEVSGENFELSSVINEYLAAFTGRDKPLYKLCQAASYIDKTMHWLNIRGHCNREWKTRAFSITQNGLESLAATYDIGLNHTDPRVYLMRDLGQAYRKAIKISHELELGNQQIVDYINFVCRELYKALPNHMAHQVRQMTDIPTTCGSINFNFSEPIEGFANPMTELTRDEVQTLLNSNEPLNQFFGQDAKTAVTTVLAEYMGSQDSVISLRDLHASAIMAGIRSAQFGKLTVLGLEGNPGIGKTTAVVNALKTMTEGFLFLYVSPRVIINDEVTRNLARTQSTGECTGILTVTTNARLIDGAKSYYDSQKKLGHADKPAIDSAVIVDGVTGLKKPNTSTLILPPCKKQEFENQEMGSRQRKRSESERQDRIVQNNLPGVLKILAKTTHDLLQCNNKINKVVLTVAIQSYRQSARVSQELQGLDSLFLHSVSKPLGVQERKTFAQKVPTVLIMVDELTGDSAGAPLIHALANWLNKQFIERFHRNPCFRVILVMSDASLGNEIVLDRYINSGDRTPDKVLVSPSAGSLKFKMAATKMKVGTSKHDVLHIMTNSYPAQALNVDYQIKLDTVTPPPSRDGKPQSISQVIKAQSRHILLDSSLTAIERAIKANAGQVIFFAQDKSMLRTLQEKLISSERLQSLKLKPNQVAVLDSSVTSAQRNQLISPENRDNTKVFLMTSSGARGVSFPKTDWIIALMPSFNIEAALMEVAQLIYRGRGQYYRGDRGEECNDGDWKNRRLCMLMQDFIVQEGESVDARQWLRQVNDLLTFFIMLRATIYTRITGDAGLDQHKLALVPVGKIGTEETLSLMSTQVRDFLKEAETFRCDSIADPEIKGLVYNTQKLVTQLFSKFSLEATARQIGQTTMVKQESIERFSKFASSLSAPLLPDPIQHPEVLLSPQLYCVGPFWLECWQEFEKQECFNIEGWLTDVDLKRQKLCNQLSRIYRIKNLPPNLRFPAKELHQILERQVDEAKREFSTVKTFSSSNTWIALPVAYDQFWKQRPDGSYPDLSDQDIWRNTLGRCLGGVGNILPVIPRYKDLPYAAVIGQTDPARLNLVFDDRYLAVSSELNLLNTILLSKKAAYEKLPH